MILEGDCVEKMREMDEASVDAIVTDPPYSLAFMGKSWDVAVDHNEWAQEALRVLKPGGHLLAFGGTRTYHRLACAIEDAGFEIRDSLIWLYGSGFPKSLDVSKAIDKQRDDYAARCVVAEWLRPYVEAHGFAEVSDHFGFKDQTMARARWTSRSQPNTPTLVQWVELKTLLAFPDEMDAEVWRLNGRKGTPGENWEKREKLGERDVPVGHAFAGPTYGGNSAAQMVDVTAPATPEAAQWEGWGTALKPGHEPIVCARKPLIGTVATNVLEHGTGALNIDGCRIEGEAQSRGGGDLSNRVTALEGGDRIRTDYETSPAGRWPANVVLSHLPECGWEHHVPGSCMCISCRQARGARRPGKCAPGCPIAELDEQSGEQKSGTAVNRNRGERIPSTVNYADHDGQDAGYGDSGGASRFFLTIESNPAEGDAGLSEGQVHDPCRADGARTPQDGDMPLTESRFRHCAKASRGERNAGLDGFEERENVDWPQSLDGNDARKAAPRANAHPTVKPIDLMRWLVRLVTPPEGTILDPFTGSGTTGVAAVLEGFDFLGIEREAEYVEIARARIAFWEPHAGRDTEDVLVEAGLSERIEREHREAGQLGLLDPSA